MAEIVINQTETTLNQPNTEIVNKQLDALIDKSKLPQNTIENSTTTNPPKDKFIKKPIFKKIIIPLIILIIVLALGSTVLTIIRRSAKTIQNKGELVWWGVTEEDSVVAPLISEFQNKFPDIRITYVRQSEKDYAQRLYNSLKKGGGPDMFEIHTSWTPDFRGLLSTVPSSVLNENDYKSIYLPSIYNSLKTKEGIVGVPLYYDALTLYVNVDIFNNARKETPKTWNDILFLSDPVKGGLTLRNKDEIIQSAVALGNTTNVDHWQDIFTFIMIQNKINPANPDLKALADVISYYKAFQENGVWNDRLPNSTTTFARGKLAMYFGTMSRAPEILRLNPEIRFKTVPLPQLPNNAPTDPQYSYANYYFQAVDKNSTNRDTAWQFLKFITEKESIARLNKERKAIRALEFPSPRNDMAADFEKDAVAGSIVYYSAVAKTWYMADRADDGEGGINNNVTSLYKAQIDKGKISKTFADDLKSLLAKYQL